MGMVFRYTGRERGEEGASDPGISASYWVQSFLETSVFFVFFVFFGCSQPR
jgi:hypothetical protein